MFILKINIFTPNLSTGSLLGFSVVFFLKQNGMAPISSDNSVWVANVQGPHIKRRTEGNL